MTNGTHRDTQGLTRNHVHVSQRPNSPGYTNTITPCEKSVKRPLVRQHTLVAPVVRPPNIQPCHGAAGHAAVSKGQTSTRKIFCGW